MEAKLKLLSQACKERKRKHDRLREALEVLHSATCEELRDISFANSNDLITVLSAKFGWKSLFLVGRLVTKLPTVVSNQLNELLVAAAIGELGRSISLEEVTLLKALLNKCQDFLDFSYENSLADISQLAAFPFTRILFPPTSVCFDCSWNLSPQNKPARVTVFEHAKSIPGIKFTLKCTNCKINFGYSMFGDTQRGYRFYDKPRPYVEASNVCYLERGLCLQHIHLA